MSVLTFPTGTYHFNDHPLFDFQLNRVVMWNHGDPAEIQARGGEITDFPSWERGLKGAFRPGGSPGGLGGRRRISSDGGSSSWRRTPRSVMLLMTGPGRSSIHTLPTCLRSKAAPSTGRRCPMRTAFCPAGGSCPQIPPRAQSCSMAATTPCWRSSPTPCCTWPRAAIRCWLLRAPARGRPCGNPA